MRKYIKTTTIIPSYVSGTTHNGGKMFHQKDPSECGGKMLAYNILPFLRPTCGPCF